MEVEGNPAVKDLLGYIFYELNQSNYKGVSLHKAILDLEEVIERFSK